MLQHSSASDSLRFVTKTVTFDGTANNGAVGTVPIFTVTGQVWVVVLVPFCTTLLTEAAPTATIVLGFNGASGRLISTTNAADIDADEFWVDTTPDNLGIAIDASLKDVAVTADIIATVGSQNVTGGVIRFDLYWRPLSSGATVVAS